jgi:hypothetical protein
MTARRFVSLVSLFATLAPGLFAATPIVIPAAGGNATLPLSGLSVVFPAREKTSLKIVSSWSFAKGYDGRDVVDEFDGTGEPTLIAGTWVQVGYFDAGGPAEVIAAEKLLDSWPVTKANLWGAEWNVRGGKYEFDDKDLGIKPALILALRSGEGPTLMFCHYFLRDAELSREDMLARAEQSSSMQAVYQSYLKSQFGSSLPTRNPAVRARNDSSPSREVVLPFNKLRLQVPDDGFVWLPDANAKSDSDRLWRMAPVFPELTLEVATVEAASVQEVVAMLTGPKSRKDPAPANLPAGWEPGPSMKLDDGSWETTVCKLIGPKVLIIGFMGTPRTTDMEPYVPVLSALAEAARQTGKTR